MKRAVRILIGMLSASFALHSNANSETFRLTSLEWPPYSGDILANQGASVLVAKLAFKAMGYELKVDIYPWLRAVKLGLDDPQYLGYFPEYYSASLEQDKCNFSSNIGISPLGFAEHKSNPIEWNSLKDLKQYKIATVAGYVNTDEFDRMAANQELDVQPAVNDIININKVFNGRVEAAVIDPRVMSYYLSTDVSLAKAKHELQFNKQLLDEKKLHICFKKQGSANAQAIFEEGLKKLDINLLLTEYFKTIE